MKTKEQLLLEIKGVLHYSKGDRVKINGYVYSSPFETDMKEVNEEAVIYDLIVPGYCAYEIVIGEEHYFCHESAIVK